jgi:hypothetical protein
MAIWRHWLELSTAMAAGRSTIELTRRPLDPWGEIKRQLHKNPLLDLPTEKNTPGPGRRRRADAAFLPVAEDYALLSAWAEPHIPKTLAAHYGLTISQASNLVREARRRGLLTRPGKAAGAAAGELTRKARDLGTQLAASQRQGVEE